MENGRAGLKKIDTASRIFEEICRCGKVSRSDVARSLSLSLPTVCSCVEVLFEEDLVRLSPGPSFGGRPSETVSPADLPILAVTVDGESCKFSAFDLMGTETLSPFIRPFIPLDFEDTVSAYKKQLSLDGIRGERLSFSAVVLISNGDNGLNAADGTPLCRLFSPRIFVNCNVDRLAAETVLSRVNYDKRLFYCSVGHKGVKAAVYDRANGANHPAPVSLRSSHGTAPARVFSLCKNGDDIAEELARMILNPLLATSPDAVVIETADTLFSTASVKRLRLILTEISETADFVLPEFISVSRNNAQIVRMALALSRRELVCKAYDDFETNVSRRIVREGSR